jgi:serine/threonine protein kinase
LLANEKLRSLTPPRIAGRRRLHHTNIVPVFGVGEQDGLCYYVMQLISGRSLDAVRRIGRPPPSRASAFGRGGSVSHGQGVLHRDVEAVRHSCSTSGTVWVTDFGVAKLVEEANLTQSGELVGTLKYMPPERFMGRSDASGDVYSLGITLHGVARWPSRLPGHHPST